MKCAVGAAAWRTLSARLAITQTHLQAAQPAASARNASTLQRPPDQFSLWIRMFMLLCRQEAEARALGRQGRGGQDQLCSQPGCAAGTGRACHPGRVHRSCPLPVRCPRSGETVCCVRGQERLAMLVVCTQHKTSCAASLGVRLAQEMHTTLTESTDPAHSPSDALAQMRPAGRSSQHCI